MTYIGQLPNKMSRVGVLDRFSNVHSYQTRKSKTHHKTPYLYDVKQIGKWITPFKNDNVYLYDNGQYISKNPSIFENKKIHLRVLMLKTRHTIDI